MVAGGLAAFFFQSKTLKVEEGLCSSGSPPPTPASPS